MTMLRWIPSCNNWELSAVAPAKVLRTCCELVPGTSGVVAQIRKGTCTRRVLDVDHIAILVMLIVNE